jgi:hypothetical protein
MKIRPVITEAQQAVLDEVQVRLIAACERESFDQLICEAHYLKSARVVGEQLRYVAEHKGRWVGLFIWSAGAFSLKLREAWIGWSAKQKRRRLPLVVNNSRFLIPEEFHLPNLASRIMKLCLDRLSADWQQAYGHEVLIAETFVDHQRFCGTSYKASGWTLLGKTQGCRRSHEDFYEPHDRPKQLWVRELKEGARTILRGRNLPAALQAVDQKHAPECAMETAAIKEMTLFFRGLPDWRKGKCDFSLSVLVTVSVCAMLSKACLGQRDLAAFAADLTRDQMAALQFPREGKPARYRPPGETTFYRLFSHLDSRSLEKALLAWQTHVLGRRDSKDDLVAVDGKELLNSLGAEVVSAYSVKEGRWLGSELVAEDSNEIPAVQELLRRADLESATVVADAMHTQDETARIIVQERGADYLFTVKGNQKGVHQSARQLCKGLLRDFSPSAAREYHANL